MRLAVSFPTCTAPNGQNVRLGRPAGVVDRFPATPLKVLQVVRDDVRNGERAGCLFVTLLSPLL